MDSLSYWLDRDATAAYFWMQQGSGVAEPLPAGYKGELKRAKRLAVRFGQLDETQVAVAEFGIERVTHRRLPRLVRLPPRAASP